MGQYIWIFGILIRTFHRIIMSPKHLSFDWNISNVQIQKWSFVFFPFNELNWRCHVSFEGWSRRFPGPRSQFWGSLEGSDDFGVLKPQFVTFVCHEICLGERGSSKGFGTLGIWLWLWPKPWECEAWPNGTRKMMEMLAIRNGRGATDRFKFLTVDIW